MGWSREEIERLNGEVKALQGDNAQLREGAEVVREQLNARIKELEGMTLCWNTVQQERDCLQVKLQQTEMILGEQKAEADRRRVLIGELLAFLDSAPYRFHYEHDRLYKDGYLSACYELAAVLREKQGLP